MQWFIFTCLTILFIVTPFQKGLYFTAQSYGVYFIILALSLSLMIRHFIIQKEYSLKSVIVVILIPISYLISFISAESPRGAMDSWIRWLAYTAFFLLLYWVSQNAKIKKWLMPAFYITGYALSFFMLFVSFGWIDFHHGILSGRFAGTFQYPNTFAMVMGAYYLLGLVLLTEKGKSHSYYLFYAIPLVNFMFCFIGAFSRGMVLILPVIWFIGLCLLPTKRQIEYVLYTIITTGCALLASQWTGIQFFVVFLLLSVGLILVVKDLLSRKLQWKGIFDKKILRFVFPILIVFVTILAILDLVFKGLGYRMLPTALQGKIDGISLQAATAQERLMFYQDALKMSLDSPIIGFGGEGWATVYRMYQQTPYLSNKIHNGYLEILIDTGWLGLLLFFLVFGYFFYVMISAYKNKRNRTNITAVNLALLVVFTHSFLDFNFSYGTIWLMVMWLLVMGISDQAAELDTVNGQGSKGQMTEKEMKKRIGTVFNRLNEETQKRWLTGAIGVFTIFILIGLVFSFRYLQGSKAFTEAKQAKSAGSRIELLQEAISYQPTNTKYLVQLGDTYMVLREKNKANLFEKEMNGIVEKLVDLEPKHSSLLVKAASYKEKLGQYHEAVKLLDKGLVVDHYETKLYEKSMELKLKLAHQEEDKKMEWAQSALKDYEQAEYWYEQFQKKNLSEAYNSQEFRITEKMRNFAEISSKIAEEL